MEYVDFNGKFYPAADPLLLASNKSYRYGDGIFETIRVVDNRLLLEERHLERLTASLTLLGMTLPKLLTPDRIRETVLGICRKNRTGRLARVRLSFFRGNGGLFEGGDGTSFIAEAWPLDDSIITLNSNGLILGVFPDACKTADRFSGVKTASFHPYPLAARFARQQQWNDSLLLNQHGRACDTTIANLFTVKDRRISTPALSEGCIDGVMRRHLFSIAEKHGLILEAKELTTDELYAADEVFLTNSIRGIRWVARIGDTTYGNRFIAGLHKLLNRSLGL